MMTTQAAAPGMLSAFESGLQIAAANCESLTDGHLHVSASEIRRLTVADVLESAGGPETPVAALYVAFSGAISGHGLLLLPMSAAHGLSASLLGSLAGEGDRPLDELSALARSALAELANVAISSVLVGLGDYMTLPIHPTVPLFLYDMAGAILDAVVSDVVGPDDWVLAARTTFTHDGREATGVLLVMPRLIGTSAPFGSNRRGLPA